jgi:hypothetical protein
VVCPAQDEEEEVGLRAKQMARHGGTFEFIRYSVWGSQVSA